MHLLGFRWLVGSQLGSHGGLEWGTGSESAEAAAHWYLAHCVEAKREEVMCSNARVSGRMGAGAGSSV